MDFTDLLSAAMSESGLIDLETSSDQAVASAESHSVVHPQPEVGIQASQKPVYFPVQPSQLQTNSIIVQQPHIQSSVRSVSPAAVPHPTDTQKGEHKIVIRPMPTGLPKSIPSRHLRPVVLQPTTNRQSLIQTNAISAGQTSAAVVKPVLPLLRTVAPHTGSSSTVCPVSSTSIRPSLNVGTLRFTAIPRQLAARLPTAEGNLSMQIRPRLPTAIVIPRTAVPAVSSIVRIAGRTVSSRDTTAGNFVQRLSSGCSVITAVLPVSGTNVICSTQLTASSAAVSVNLLASSANTASSLSEPVITSMQNTQSYVTVDSTSPLFVTSASLNSELSLKNTNTKVQVDTGIDSCSALESSVACNNDTSAGISHVCTESLHTSTSSSQCDMISTLASSNITSVVTADSEAAAVTKSHCSDEAEADDQQVRLANWHLLIIKYKYFTFIA